MVKKKIGLLIYSLENIEGIDVGLPYQSLDWTRKFVVEFLESVFATEMGLPVEVIDMGDLSEGFSEAWGDEIRKSIRTAPGFVHKQVEIGPLNRSAYLKSISKATPRNEGVLLITPYDLYAANWENNNFICSRGCLHDTVLSTFRFHFVNAVDAWNAMDVYKKRVQYASLHIGYSFIGIRLDNKHPHNEDDTVCINKYYNSVGELDRLIHSLKEHPLRKRIPYCEDCQDEFQKAVESLSKN